MNPEKKALSSLIRHFAPIYAMQLFRIRGKQGSPNEPKGANSAAVLESMCITAKLIDGSVQSMRVEIIDRRFVSLFVFPSSCIGPLGDNGNMNTES